MNRHSLRPVLPLPPHFDLASVESVWRVEYAVRAQEALAWAATHRIRPAAQDEVRICLFLIDCQNTFCLPDHELFVGGRSGRGAIDDNVRLCDFLYRHLGMVTEIVATLDTHTSIQIFHPAFWVDATGKHPEAAVTVITVEDIEDGTWRVNPAIVGGVGDGSYEWLEAHALHYVRTLAEGRYPLTVWPYHAMLGGIGHALVSAVEEAAFFHGISRQTAVRFETKGSNPLTENYSALSPEVLLGHSGEAIAERNQTLLDHLFGFDAILVAGQAKSHCVAWSVQDLLSEAQDRDSSLAGRVYLLEDCTSPVVVPGIVDFTDPAHAAFQRFADAGMHIVRSTDAVETWADFPS